MSVSFTCSNAQCAKPEFIPYPSPLVDFKMLCIHHLFKIWVVFVKILVWEVFVNAYAFFSISVNNFIDMKQKIWGLDQAWCRGDGNEDWQGPDVFLQIHMNISSIIVKDRWRQLGCKIHFQFHVLNVSVGTCVFRGLWMPFNDYMKQYINRGLDLDITARGNFIWTVGWLKNDNITIISYQRDHSGYSHS